MKKVSCKDIDSSINCNFEASGQNAKEVVGKMVAHMKSDHMDKISGMSDGDMRTMIEAKVHE